MRSLLPILLLVGATCFEGTQSGVDDSTDANGCSGTHLYGAICGVAVQSNTYSRIKSGTEIWSQMPSSAGVQPSLFNFIADNTYISNRFGIEMTFSDWQAPVTVPKYHTHAGNVLRNNTFTAPVVAAYVYTSSEPWSMFGLNVIDGGSVSNAPTATDYDSDRFRAWTFVVPTATSNQLFIGNTSTNVTTNIYIWGRAPGFTSRITPRMGSMRATQTG